MAYQYPNICCFFVVLLYVFVAVRNYLKLRLYNTAVQSRKAVSPYFTNKQILHFGLVEQNRMSVVWQPGNCALICTQQ